MGIKYDHNTISYDNDDNANDSGEEIDVDEIEN